MENAMQQRGFRIVSTFPLWRTAAAPKVNYFVQNNEVYLGYQLLQGEVNLKLRLRQRYCVTLGPTAVLSLFLKVISLIVVPSLSFHKPEHVLERVAYVINFKPAFVRNVVYRRLLEALITLQVKVFVARAQLLRKAL